MPPKSQTPISEEHDTGYDVDHPMPDLSHQNPSPLSSRSDTDSGSEDDDDDAQDKFQLQNLEADLSTNPSNYDTHVQVCRGLRFVAVEARGEIDCHWEHSLFQWLFLFLLNFLCYLFYF